MGRGSGGGGRGGGKATPKTSSKPSNIASSLSSLIHKLGDNQKIENRMTILGEIDKLVAKHGKQAVQEAVSKISGDFGTGASGSSGFRNPEAQSNNVRWMKSYVNNS